MLNSGKDGYSASVSENPDRGFARGYLYFGNDEILNLKKAFGFLCADCLNSILEESWDTPYGVGIINFKTRKIRLLEENVSAFINSKSGDSFHKTHHRLLYIYFTYHRLLSSHL